MCLQEPMKARVLMCDVIRKICMTRDYSEMNENTFSPISLTIVVCTLALSVL